MVQNCVESRVVQTREFLFLR
jgi:hypothetical protein